MPPFEPRSLAGRDPGARGRILGIGRSIIATENAGFEAVAQSIAQGRAQTTFEPVVSGVARLWWQISSVIVAPPSTVTPRVRITWSAQSENARGSLLNPPTPTPPGLFDPASQNQPPFMLCDGWYGQVELEGTSFKIEAGYLPEDVRGGSWVLQAIITEGGTGAEQYATFTRSVTLSEVAPTATVSIPGRVVGGINNGAHRCRSLCWFAGVARDVTLTVSDFAGNPRELIRTGAVAAPAIYGPQEWPLIDCAASVLVDAGGLSINNGSLRFRYF